MNVCQYYKKYPLNIFKISQWSYLITKQKLKWERNNLIKRKIKKIWSSITSKSTTNG